MCGGCMLVVSRRMQSAAMGFRSGLSTMAASILNEESQASMQVTNYRAIADTSSSVVRGQEDGRDEVKLLKHQGKIGIMKEQVAEIQRAAQQLAVAEEQRTATEQYNHFLAMILEGNTS